MVIFIVGNSLSAACAVMCAVECQNIFFPSSSLNVSICIFAFFVIGWFRSVGVLFILIASASFASFGPIFCAIVVPVVPFLNFSVFPSGSVIFFFSIICFIVGFWGL